MAAQTDDPALSIGTRCGFNADYRPGGLVPFGFYPTTKAQAPALLTHWHSPWLPGFKVTFYEHMVSQFQWQGWSACSQILRGSPTFPTPANPLLLTTYAAVPRCLRSPATSRDNKGNSL
jgi:hypothetical protein